MNNSAKKKMKLQWKNRRFYFFRFDNSQFLLLDALPFCDSFVLALPWQPKMSVHTHTHNGGNAQINSWFWKKTKKKGSQFMFFFSSATCFSLLFIFIRFFYVSLLSDRRSVSFFFPPFPSDNLYRERGNSFSSYTTIRPANKKEKQFFCCLFINDLALYREKKKWSIVYWIVDRYTSF